MAYLTFAYHPATDRTRHRTASAWSPGVADGPGDYGESVTLTVSAQVALILAGLIFLWALLLGIWKFQQIARSPQGQAHVYVSGYVVTILHDWRPLPSWIGSYDKRAAAEHVMDDISAEIGATRRRRK